MRDWTKLLPASFNGITFHVEGEEISGGRRLAIHETAGGEVPVIEDMGRAVYAINATAYLTGDLADFQANALIAAAALPGPGFLVLPIDGPMMVHVTDGGFSRSRSKDRNGYIAVDLSFIPVAPPSGYSLGLGDIAFAFSSGFGGAALSLSVRF